MKSGLELECESLAKRERTRYKVNRALAWSAGVVLAAVIALGICQVAIHVAPTGFIVATFLVVPLWSSISGMRDARELAEDYAALAKRAASVRPALSFAEDSHYTKNPK